jgi:predicted Fe-Mo cluster-binding NifX family protein
VAGVGCVIIEAGGRCGIRTLIRGDVMKIVITSQGKELNSEIDPRFGRSRYFIFIDTETGESEAIGNEQELNAVQGAGIQAAEFVSRNGAEWVLTGNCGPKAYRTLSAAGINVSVQVTGTVQEAFEMFKRGELTPAKEANVEGHWA